MMTRSGIAASSLLAGVIPARTIAWAIDRVLILNPRAECLVLHVSLPLALGHLPGTVAGEQHLELTDILPGVVFSHHLVIGEPAGGALIRWGCALPRRANDLSA